MRIVRTFGLTIVLIILSAVLINSQTSAFRFQGSLSDSGSPANGNFQMQFKLFDAVSGGNQVGPTLTDQPITATNGIFTLSLDFGIGPLSGANRWIEIAVRRNAGESYVTLSPREQIASAPFSVRALSAQQADTALDSQKLGGVNANQFVQTTDARLSDSRTPLPGSTSYVQNQNAAPQAGSNFNIAGSGTATSFNVNGPFNFGAVAAPPVAPAGQSRFYFDPATNKLRVSENGQPFVNLVGATGVSGSGSVNRIPFFSAATTLSDSNIFQSGSNIGIGIAPQSRFHAGGTAWFSGDSTPLPAAAGKGIAVGFAAEQGYIYGFDYTAFTPKNLIINHTGGSVGIGTATPDPGYRLDIGGATRVTAPAAAHFVAQTTGGTNTWARNYWRSTSQSWFMGTSQGFNGNQLYIADETSNQTRLSIQPNGGPINVSGGITQTLSGYGLPKAMLWVQGAGNPYGILRCYNGITGSTAGDCGFQVIREGTGRYAVDLNFNVIDRFVSVTPYSQGGTLFNAWAGPNVYSSNPESLTVHLFRPDGSAIDAEFYLIVY